MDGTLHQTDLGFWDYLSRASDISGIVSLLIALGLIFFAKSIRDKFQEYRSIENQIIELKILLQRLSTGKGNAYIPKGVRSEIKSVFIHVKDYHSSNMPLVHLISSYVNTLENDPNCTKGAMRLAIKEIMTKIQVSPELEYAIK
ncbi:MAG: hypothetical protein AB7I27_13755 [Bacteriovoracaceae bacterium]